MEDQNAWKEIVSEVAHDLKTPITAARGFIDLMLTCGDALSPRQERYATIALSALDHMEQVVARLLEAAWIEEGRPLVLQPCDLAMIIRRAVSATTGFAERHQVSLIVELAPDLGSINADERRLGQIILNLLSNAVKYNRAGGHVWVTASRAAKSVEIVVSDDGRGIAPDDLPRIFDRFFRADGGGEKVEGTGLGLAIVKALVEKHGGNVHVASVVDAGSTFTLNFPCAIRLGDREEAARERVSTADEGTDSIDFVPSESSEELDSVDDNLQEPQQILQDEDDLDVAQQE